ncbi:MAG: Alpha-amylase [Promethearchaeota archaeon]|nr:MAG: Alpha-amylase [Candidatus Lokiarchaeota archaeon]
MKLSKTARNLYEVSDIVNKCIDNLGNIIFEGRIYDVRLFVEKLNQKRDLINFPEKAIRIGYFNGMAITFEIYDHIINDYNSQYPDLNLYEELYNFLEDKVGKEDLDETIKNLVVQFPPKEIETNQMEVDDFLERKTDNIENKKLFMKEFINLWLGNTNPSFSEYLELFNDEYLQKKPQYQQICDHISTFFEDKPPFGNTNKTPIKLLKEPIEKYPHSIKNQLEYIHKNWEPFLGKYSLLVLTALDLIREEELFRGLGPGEAKILDYADLEYENYTPDKEWMPKVVMIAKHTYVWLDQLSKKYNHTITKLNEIPNEELDQLSRWGFNGLWLIGVWERSQASKTIKRWCGNPEAEASAYSIYDYQIAYDLGGYEAYKNLKERAWARGIRLASDMVPNHTGIVSKWTIEHPDWFIQLDYKPFPSYSYSGQSLSGDPNIGIFLEDKYFSQSDAAVTLKRIDYRYNDTRYIYHGNDGTSFPWNDTAQLNYLIPEVREAVIQKILDVSRMFPIIRFDAAMTLTRKHFQRLWFPEPGTGGAIPSRAEHGMSREEFFKQMPEEFWREVVDRIKKENPDTLLIAEAFWLLEGFFVRTLGMHRVYNSAFMNMLSNEDNAKYRAVLKNTLQFDPKILKRFVNFMNNPDEETAIRQFGDGRKYFGVCAMLVTVPGLPMFGHGQIQGFHEKYGMEYRRCYWDEQINWDLLHHHENTIFQIMRKRYIFAEVKNFLLYDFWTGNVVNEDVFAYSNKAGNERALVVYNNKYSETSGYIKYSVGFAVENGENKQVIQKTLGEGLELPSEGYCIFKDYMSGLEYIRRNNEIHEKGLYVELDAYKSFVFMEFRILEDNEFFHYAQLHDLLHGKGVYNIQDTLQQLIYQPLHSPLEKIINKKQFEELLEIKDKEALFNSISEKLDTFLEEAKNYSAGKNNIESIKREILNKLKISLRLNSQISSFNFSSELNTKMRIILPESKSGWALFFSWNFLHLLGKLVSENNYELISTSWINEWNLSKIIKMILREFSRDQTQEGEDALTLIKLLIHHQNLLSPTNLQQNSIDILLKKLFSDTEAQHYFQLNRFQNVLWFSKENFFKFCNWILLITIITRISKDTAVESIELKEMITMIEKLKNIAEQSAFKVNDFLEGVSEIIL